MLCHAFTAPLLRPSRCLACYILGVCDFQFRLGWKHYNGIIETDERHHNRRQTNPRKIRLEIEKQMWGNMFIMYVFADFRGLGRPWVGTFGVFNTNLTCFPSQLLPNQNR